MGDPTTLGLSRKQLFCLVFSVVQFASRTNNFGPARFFCPALEGGSILIQGEPGARGFPKGSGEKKKKTRKNQRRPFFFFFFFFCFIWDLRPPKTKKK